MFNPRTTATIIAALRFFQGARYHNTLVGSDEHFHDHSPLLSDEIDTLIERINFAEPDPILTAFKDALDTLLNATVDADLEAGIGLTEAEEAARSQALACFLIHPLGQSEPKQPTPEEVAETILADIRQDEQLAACTTFEQLHDHCDANMLGCSALLLETFGMEKATDILNAAQEIVTAALPITD